MADPLISVGGLSKTYRVGASEVHALRGIDIAVERGDCMAVVGESGSGKTTLARLLLGIEAPSGGEMIFDGAALTPERPRALRRRLQYVQQNPMSALNPKRTILQSIALPLAVHGLADRRTQRARASELLAMVGISPEFLDRFPGTLSGGQRQRVAIARALAAEPDCIILDEPTSSLDVSVQARVLNLLVELQARLSLTYLFITHDLSVVRNVSRRMTVLYRGRVVETGDTARVFARPRHRYTQMLLSSIPVVSDEEAKHKPDWPWERDIAAGERVAETGCPFSPRCAFAIDACREAEPALRACADDHRAACCNPG